MVILYYCFLQNLPSYNLLFESINKILATILVIISLVTPFFTRFCTKSIRKHYHETNTNHIKESN